MLLLMQLVSLSDAFPIGISIVALIFSIISSFKDELFPFRLTTFIDGLFLVAAKPMTQSTNVTVQVLLPITFFNRGYSEGVIQNIKLSVKAESETTLWSFMPILEVDMTAFMQQHKGLNASNIENVFVGFLLGGKRGIKKNILFTASTEEKNAIFEWKPNIYRFELYIQIFGEDKMKKYATLHRNIGINSFTMLANGQTNVVFVYPD